MHTVETEEGRKWIELFANPMINDSSREITGAVEFVRDITERMIAQEELRVSHARMELILNSLDALVYIIDFETYELLFINEFGRRIWGEDYHGRPCWEVLQAGMSGPCEFCRSHQLEKLDGNSSGVLRWQLQNTVDGRWYDVRERLIKWEDGRTAKIHIGIDITDERDAQLSLQQQLREKETVLRETHHRIKNNFAVVESLLNIHADRSSHPEAVAGLEDARSRTTSVRVL